MIADSRISSLLYLSSSKKAKE